MITRRFAVNGMRRLLGLVALWLVAPLAAAAQVVEYYHLDSVGSVRVVTDASGAAVERHDYLPFGEEWQTTTAPQPLRFTGKERDAETGLDYFGARYQRASLGRFTSVDPALTIAENTVDPQRWNRYAYARNNPLRFVDADGRDWLYRTVMNTMMGSQYVQQNGDRSSVSVFFEGIAGDLPRAWPQFIEQVSTDIAIAELILMGQPAAPWAPGRSAGAASEPGGGVVIGKLGDLEAPGALRPGETRLTWPDKGSPRANWSENFSRLHNVLRRGKSVRDASVDPATGALRDNTGFLRLEREILSDRGWSYDPKTTMWNPPVPGGW